ncbi:N-acetyltransferase [Alkalicoccobacillus murimartini]|uniref:Acetyltransferase n=1 Tax=Alkalicoccobacillus murimartini TaxID=171685 RepID=A0ABT9YFD4_9BACI|nr:N-acetyltransferase [Alkalicoccobacillus murimartini]MDQ0206525.1 putative acetyltransferase [Alkalicoccobacillus murimartini]
MIRPLESNDVEQVVAIWLESSLQAHYFIADAYWQDQQAAMRDEYIPQSETLVLEENRVVLGFVSLVDEQIAALFVDVNAQGKGYGKHLLQEVQKHKKSLSLQVYKKNKKAIQFYQNQGFKKIEDQIDSATGEEEYVMEWKSEQI